MIKLALYVFLHEKEPGYKAMIKLALYLFLHEKEPGYKAMIKPSGLVGG